MLLSTSFKGSESVGVWGKGWLLLCWKPRLKCIPSRSLTAKSPLKSDQNAPIGSRVVFQPPTIFQGKTRCWTSGVYRFAARVTRVTREVVWFCRRNVKDIVWWLILESYVVSVFIFLNFGQTFSWLLFCLNSVTSPPRPRFVSRLQTSSWFFRVTRFLKMLKRQCALQLSMTRCELIVSWLVIEFNSFGEWKVFRLGQGDHLPIPNRQTRTNSEDSLQVASFDNTYFSSSSRSLHIYIYIYMIIYYPSMDVVFSGNHTTGLFLY